MSKYFINILFLLLSFTASAQMDDSSDAEKPAIKLDSLHQLRIGIDVTRPVINYLADDHKSYEFEADYYFKKELYFVAEGGWGEAHITDTNLNYDSKNSFFKIGINKCMLARISKKDWDMAFIGVRYGVGLIQRGKASYTVDDLIWGKVSGTKEAKNFTGHWVEITGGVKVELYKGIYAGWNIRGKFLMNPKAFKELAPAYVAGYGKGDKNSVFDFNFYLSYAIRWKKQHTRINIPAARK